jgi:hypothetical protein
MNGHVKSNKIQIHFINIIVFVNFIFFVLFSFLFISDWSGSYNAVTRARRLFKNGQLDYYDNAGTAGLNANGQITLSGAPGFPTTVLNGELDELRFWSRTLSDGELKSSFRNSFVGGVNDNLSAFYKFSEVSNKNTIYDHSGNGRHLTTPNTDLVLDSKLCLPAVACAFGSSDDGHIRFSNPGSYAATTVDRTISGDLSFSIWLRREQLGSMYAFSFGPAATNQILVVGFRPTDAFVFGFGANDMVTNSFHTELGSWIRK